MDLPLEKSDKLKYEVPLLQYFVSIEVEPDRAGYEKLKVYIQRNISRAMMLLDQPNANRFRKDWFNAIEMFHKTGVLDDEYAASERILAENYDAIAVRQGAQMVMQGVKTAASEGWLWKGLAALGIGLGIVGLVKSAKQKRVR